MLRKPLLLLMAGLLLATAFCIGVAQLFILRFEGGDVYPPYSSLRADPLGGKALYEALGQISGVDVQRNYKPLPKLKPAGPITLVYEGVARYATWDDRELLDFNALVLEGTRAVFMFYPAEHSVAIEEEKRAEKEARDKKEAKQSEAKEKAKGRKLGAKNNKDAGTKDAQKHDAAKKKEGAASKDKTKKKGEGGKEDEDDDSLAKSSFINFREAANRWGFAFDFLPPDEKNAFHRRAVAQADARGLEPEISWHSALCFKDLKPEWKVLYRCEDRPVIIERKYGTGSLLFAGDSFFVSNEALRTDRSPKLLAHLFDGPATVVFDEEHNNVRETPGIATLARKYRLHGVVAGLLLLTALFVWKNSVRFLPAQDSGSGADAVVAGKESGEGFVNLLRRTIKPSQALAVCIAEWRKSFPTQKKEMAKIDEIFGQEQSRPARERNTVAAFLAICQSLAHKR